MIASALPNLFPLGTNIEAPYLRLAASSLVHPSGAFTRGLNSGHNRSCRSQTWMILSTSARAGNIAQTVTKVMPKMKRRIAGKLRAIKQETESQPKLGCSSNSSRLLHSLDRNELPHQEPSVSPYLPSYWPI